MTDLNDLTNHLMDAQEIAGKMGKNNLAAAIGEWILKLEPEIIKDVLNTTNKINDADITFSRTTEDLNLHSTHDLRTPPKKITNLPDPEKPGAQFK